MANASNLYVHFPFCRRKCTYCALHSRAGQPAAVKGSAVRQLCRAIASLGAETIANLKTIYFGGGSPALCDLQPLFDLLKPAHAEWTVELHPLDVTAPLLATLKHGGVNRISMGVQSLDDATLRAMGRGYTVAEAQAAFRQIRQVFDNAGIDLIVGYPGDTSDYTQLNDWDIQHCSVYSLIREDDAILAKTYQGDYPTDDEVLNTLSAVAQILTAKGLERYEISNYAQPGFACQHNLATWRGEDYYGFGEGAHGRLGRTRTVNGVVTETLTPEQDKLERTLFRLRTREGLDATEYPAWRPILDNFVAQGLLSHPQPNIYTLTPRGTEVCDTILADLI